MGSRLDVPAKGRHRDSGDIDYLVGRDQLSEGDGATLHGQRRLKQARGTVDLQYSIAGRIGETMEPVI